MIGSRRKARLIREQFLEDKIASSKEMDKLSCPVGLDIGAVGVHEIAVSILAQYIQKRAEYVAQTSGIARPRPELARG
jgi:xanthine dehydrogenase accessory factor